MTLEEKFPKESVRLPKQLAMLFLALVRGFSVLLADKKLYFLGQFKGKDVFYSELIDDFVALKSKSHPVNGLLLPLAGGISTLLSLILKKLNISFRTIISMNIILLLLAMFLIFFTFLVVKKYHKKMVDIEKVCFTTDEFVTFYKITKIKLFFLLLMKFILVMLFVVIVLLYVSQGDMYTFLLLNFLFPNL